MCSTSSILRHGHVTNRWIKSMEWGKLKCIGWLDMKQGPNRVSEIFLFKDLIDFSIFIYFLFFFAVRFTDELKRIFSRTIWTQNRLEERHWKFNQVTIAFVEDVRIQPHLLTGNDMAIFWSQRTWFSSCAWCKQNLRRRYRSPWRIM